MGFFLGEKKLRFLGLPLEKYCLVLCDNQKAMSLSLTVNDAIANSVSFISAQTICICLKVDFPEKKPGRPINGLILSVP